MTQKIDSLWSGICFILMVSELFPCLFRVLSNWLFEDISFRYLDLLFRKHFEHVLSSHNFCNLDQLVNIVSPSKERVLSENDRCEQRSKSPHVNGKVIKAMTKKDLRSFEIHGWHSCIQLFSLNVKLCLSEVNQSELFCFFVY